MVNDAGNGLAPMGLLFQFLNLLRAAGPQQWVFDELANIAQMRFKFAEEEDACEYALRLAADAPYYAPEHLLNGHYLYDRWYPKLVSRPYTAVKGVLTSLDCGSFLYTPNAQASGVSQYMHVSRALPALQSCPVMDVIPERFPLIWI